ncbi:energy transducer TonB [Oceanicoccus sp. KOV_DT_Chl]|uniref:energy transducer TonB n=1 Tax=Oceanicoccus sp. KOV_DT_Chl TaxID=1904639 RepID=UPI00190EC38B|nr:energy transducer TonB [Oceanicoccus sp. KOV_DT_Chl]
MNYLRILIGAGLAALVTAGLFYIMPLLIEMADKTLDEKPAAKIADITMPDRVIESNTKEPKPDKPEDPEEPPPDLAPPEVDNVDINPDAVNMSPQLSADVNIGLGNGIGGADGEYLPIVKVAPMYPRRANSRGVEGYCTIEYTVTKNGSIKDPVAVDCEPQGYFERASIKAALKFKYKPRVIDGEGIDVLGVQNRFTYELEK